MPNFKCKMCGGEINIIEDRLGKCEFCDTKVLLPKIRHDRVVMWYNRGNHFRNVGEYDRAYSEFENIIAEDRDDAEAHWNLVLCRYGITYVRDEDSGEFKPTISRMNNTLVIEDPDYQAAIRSSDEETQKFYRAEAKKIYNIQLEYQDIIKRENPYDVFICFKAKDEEGNHTKASEIGQDIYEQLTAKGLRVFFSRITLDNFVGAYEPYIFSALNSAKVMLVVANEPKQLSAKWVKNEWMRFLAMMDKDKNKYLIPVFYGMSPYDLPPEFSGLQGQDMEKIGALHDLEENVLSKLGKSGPKVEIQVNRNESQKSLTPMIKRVKMLMEDKEYDEAKGKIRELIREIGKLEESKKEINPEEKDQITEVYYLALLVNNQVTLLDELIKIKLDWKKDPDYEKLRKYQNEEIKKQLDEFEKVLALEEIYRNGVALYKEKNYLAAKELFEKIEDYRDSHSMILDIQRKLDLEKKIKEYEKETGDLRTYVDRHLDDEYPGIYREYNKIRRKKVDASFSEDMNWAPPIISVVFWIASYFIVQNTKVESFLDYGAYLFIILVLGIVIFIGIAMDSFNVGFWGSMIALVVMWVLSRGIYKLACWGGLIGVILLTIYFWVAIILKTHNSIQENKAHAYYKKVIEPKRKEIIDAYYAKWTPIIGQANVKKIY